MTQKIYLQAAAQIELKEANKEHPMFHSAHEAWAVTKEELDECEYELCGMQYTMQSMWEDVKDDEPMCEKMKQYEELQKVTKGC